MDAEELKNMTPEEILELQKKNCIFCKIIAKEIPSFEIYSDDKAFVILDINPGNEGHCLVLPKSHFQILPQIPDEIISHLFRIAKNTSRSLLKSLGIQGTTIFVANGALAGQKAPHFMIHVVPRKPGDLLFTIPKHAIEEDKINELRERLYLYLNKKPLEKEKINSVKSKGSEDLDEDKKTDLDDESEDINDILGNDKEQENDVEEEMQENNDLVEDKDESDGASDKKQKSSSVNIDDIANMFL